jgi:hypothetical protein
MTTISELQILADELTELLPPPTRPAGVNLVVVGSGKWKIVPVGSGSYAMRIEYEHPDGHSFVVRSEKEIAGFPNALRQSLEFMVTLHTATRHHWLPV